MNKNIKSRKRKTYKDPLSNSKQKFEKIKNKINKAPSNPDDQEIPRAFQSIQSALTLRKREKNKAKALRKKQSKILASQQNSSKGLNIQREKRKQNKTKKMVISKKDDNLINTADFLEKNIGWYPHNGRPFKPIPTLKQLPNESFRSFKQRVAAVTDTVIYESKFRDKYNVDVVRNEAGDVVNMVKLRSEKAREKRRLRDKEKKLKLKLKKNKSNINADNSENPNPEEDIDALERKLFRKEKIEFGDIVHKPPSLNTEKLDKLLKSKKDEKNFLFLQNLQKETKINQHKKPSEIKKKANRDLEAERVAAVQAYRQLKLKKKSIETAMIT